MRDFWQKYPSQLDIRGAGTAQASAWSPPGTITGLRRVQPPVSAPIEAPIATKVPGMLINEMHTQLAKVTGADVPDEAKRLILGGNLRRLLKPILDAKGVRL